MADHGARVAKKDRAVTHRPWLLRARRFAGALAAGWIAVAVFTATGTTSSVANASTPGVFVPDTELRGEGAWSVLELNTRWHNELASGTKPLDFRYTSVGSFFGRQDFLAGDTDFVISGVPFSNAELTNAKKTDADVIAAPVVAASLAIAYQSPDNDKRGFQTFEQVCDPSDRSTWPPGVTNAQQCFHWRQLTGPIHVPADNLTAMLFSYPLPSDRNNPDETGMLAWDNAAVLQSLGVENLLSMPAGVGPSAVMRSDPDETMYFLQQWAAQGAPATWNRLKDFYPTLHWDPISETVARIGSSSRGQADQQADVLKWPESNPGTGAQANGGVIAPIPASLVAEPKATWSFNNPPADFVGELPMKNGSGEWVEPTSDSITKAIAAGNAAPLYALGNAVPGAYPLAWVDTLYAPAHGLSADKTEAMATMIRYLATAGQDAAPPVGEGKLSAPLVAQALHAADQLVQSNCVGADRKITSSTQPGAMAPNLPALAAIGTMLHCESLVPPTTTTTVGSSPPTTNSFGGTGSSSSGGGTSTGSFSDSTSSSSGANSSAANGDSGSSGDGTNNSSTKKNARVLPALMTAQNLPLNTESSNQVDRLGAFLLGVVLFLLLRKPAGQLINKVLP
jgi:hypothetical protein